MITVSTIFRGEYHKIQRETNLWTNFFDSKYESAVDNWNVYKTKEAKSKDDLLFWR